MPGLPRLVAFWDHERVRVMFASLAAYGHLYPMMPLASACADAGHDVVIATGETFLGRLPLPTVPAYPRSLTLQGTIRETRRRHPELHGEAFTTAMFAEVAPETTVPSMLEQCDRAEPDLVVFEGMHTGAGVAASVRGIPAAAFAIALAAGIYGPLHSSTTESQREAWTSRDRDVPAAGLLADALITPVPPSLRGDDSAGRLIPIRSVAYSEPDATAPAWLSAPAEWPRIYLTLGTVSSVAVDVLRRAVHELAELDAEILVALGPDGDADALGEAPTGVHVERFVAQSAVLPHIDLIVHHGGTGTVLAALEAGLPQLLLPQHADQFLNADILAAVHAARALTDVLARPGEVEAMARALLAGTAERSAALALRDEIAAMPAPAEIVPALEELAVSAA